MAHTKAQGSVKGNRDSRPKFLGVKIYGGQKTIAGNIIVRQRGNKFHAGKGVSTGNDFTLFATQEGTVKYKKFLGKNIVEVVHE